MGCGPSQSVGVVESATSHGRDYEKNMELVHYQSKKRMSVFPLSSASRGQKVNMFGDNSSDDSGLGDTNYGADKRGGNSATNSRSSAGRKVVNKPRSAQESSNSQGFDMRKLPPLNLGKPSRAASQDTNGDILRQTGLVQTAVVKKDTYAHFEIVEEKMLNRNLSMLTLKSNSDSMYQLKPSGPPARLLLQRERTLTADQIEEKLERANQRKLEQTQQKLKGLNSSISIENRADKYDYIKKDLARQQGEDEGFKKDVQERQQRLQEMRAKLRAKQQSQKKATPTVPNPKEAEKELEKFRPQAPTNFKPVYN